MNIRTACNRGIYIHYKKENGRPGSPDVSHFTLKNFQNTHFQNIFKTAIIGIVPKKHYLLFNLPIFRVLKIILYSEIRKYNVSNCTCKIPTYQTLIRVKYKAPKNATYFQFWYLCAKHQCFSTWKILLLKNHYIVFQFNLITPK